MTKEECLEKYKEQLRKNNDYMGMSSRTLALIESDKWAAFVISSLLQEVWGINEENKSLRSDLEWATSGWKVGSVLGLDNMKRMVEIRTRHNLDKSEGV